VLREAELVCHPKAKALAQSCRDRLRAGGPRGRSSSAAMAKNSHLNSGCPPSLLSTGYAEVKRPGCEAGHLPATSAEI
jgi:hypothetical protein